MRTRRLLLPVVAGATLAAGLTCSTPAAASVTYDPATKTGFVSGGDLRKAFGWTDATLAARAPGVVFDHEFWTNDTYVVACGGPAFPLEHHSVFGRFQLAADVVRDRRRAGAGYRGSAAGFRLAGPRLGISGVSVRPAVGHPCPRPGRGPAIDKVRLVSTADGWSLSATSGRDHRVLLKG